jgi:type IV secretory pathway component VirB8
MQDEREKVTELLKSGKYYDEAIKWYNSRYVMAKTQVASMALCALIALTFFIVSFVSTVSIFPLSYSETFDVNRQVALTEGMTVRPIGDRREDPSVAYLKYMLKQYVRSREEYNPSKTDRNFNFVIDLSSDSIFVDYLALADKTQNPNHPVWQYGSQAIKEIFVNDINLIDLDPKLKNFDPNKQYKANIKFVSSLLFVDNLQTQEKYEAEVTFKFDPIILNQQTNEIKQLPKLLITDYKTKKL